ncbi:MAG TPA: hypothetical protein EYQ24_10410 [Bacteroidetes bacterium]|nr:hypothetical protein [Bacteroidota bacterium]
MPTPTDDTFTEAFNQVVADRGFNKRQVIEHLKRFGISKSYSTIQNYMKPTASGGTQPATDDEAQSILQALRSEAPAASAEEKRTTITVPDLPPGFADAQQPQTAGAVLFRIRTSDGRVIMEYRGVGVQVGEPVDIVLETPPSASPAGG